MTNEHKCNQCFYAQYEKDEAPCSGCTGYSKFVKRDIYIKTPSSAPSFQPLQKAINEWHMEQELNKGCNGLSSKELNDAVNRPKHYTEHPSGIECIEVTEHMGFNLGNAVKYIWRCDLKKDAIEDLKKAKWYIEREIEKRVSNF